MALVMLFGAARAEAVPSVSYKCSPAPQNCSGWYRSNVSIDWTVVPSDATVVAGCQDKSFTTDTVGTNEFCKADDGEATVTVELKIKVDKTPPPVLSGTPGRGADVNGWYNHPVAIAFSGSDLMSGIDSCSSPTYSGPDSGAASLSGTCTDVAGNVSSPLGFGLKYDATGPVLQGTNPDRPANANGWYNQPVSFAFQAGDTTSGVADCTPVTYSGPDSGTASVTGSCRDRAGNTGSRAFGLKYDATPPVVRSATPERDPDVNGWYNRPVTFLVDGTDATSGIAECPAVTYDGPDGPSAAMIGECRDNAGNISRDAFELMFDATAPPIMDLAATPADRSVAVSWRTTPDAESVGVKRTPGVGVDVSSVVFSGPGTSFMDSQVENGVRYAYEVSVGDSAGNLRSGTVTAVPTAAVAAIEGAPTSATPPAPAADRSPAPSVRRRPHLIAPAAGAVVSPRHPPLLRWTRVPGAEYYNVQLFRGGKVLTAWPAEPRYRLKRRWRYGGRLRRLVPGHYHWVVWPGFGPRAKADYGRRIGRRDFEVGSSRP